MFIDLFTIEFSFILQSVNSLFPCPLSPTLQNDLPMLDCDTNADLTLNSYGLIMNADSDQLSLEIEKER